MKNPKQINYRRCISCQKIDEKTKFWRIIRNYPEQEITLDKGMGRSAYLCPQAECLNLAKKKKRLAKVLKVDIPPQIYEKLWLRLE